MGTPSYEGKQVYMGLDVHREFFVASCICDGVVVQRCRMPGTAEAVISLVSREFGGASVRAAYGAGLTLHWYAPLVRSTGTGQLWTGSFFCVVFACCADESVRSRVALYQIERDESVRSRVALYQIERAEEILNHAVRGFYRAVSEKNGWGPELNEIGSLSRQLWGNV